MNHPEQFHSPDSFRIADVRIPRSVVAKPDHFGGRPAGAYLSGDLVVQKGKIMRLEAPSEVCIPSLVVPRLSEVHAHLDKCHTVDRMTAVGGDLVAAIAAQSLDKQNWTEEDLQSRAARGLEELIAAGCKTVRTHVDWPSGYQARTPPLAWHVLTELAQDKKGRVDLQLAPLVSLADLHDPETARTLGREIARMSGALGSFVLDHSHREAGIKAAFRIATEYGVPLDFHVDEGLAQGLNGLEIIAQTALDMSFDAPVLCGHASSLINLDGSELTRAVDLIAKSGVSVAALPTTNLYLQGRREGTPDRRGVTRLSELRSAGVPVLVGSDNVRDAFCPIGRHDPVASLSLAILTAHLDPPLADLWPMISTDAATALGKDPTFVDGARADDVLICNASSTTDLLSGGAILRKLEPTIQGSTL